MSSVVCQENSVPGSAYNFAPHYLAALFQSLFKSNAYVWSKSDCWMNSPKQRKVLRVQGKLIISKGENDRL